MMEMPSHPEIMRHLRNRAASREGADFLFDEAGGRLATTVADITLPSFPSILELGTRKGHLSTHVRRLFSAADITLTDPAPAMADITGATVLKDDSEFPFSDEKFDLVISCLYPHRSPTPTNLLAEVRRTLKPGGIFLFSMPGMQSLQEVRNLAPERETLRPPFPELPGLITLGNALENAGFTDVCVDTEELEITYTSARQLFKDLHDAGESAAHPAREKTGMLRGDIEKLVQTMESDAWAPDQILVTCELLTARAGRKGR